MKNFLGMSDEDFLKEAQPEPTETTATPEVVETPTESVTQELPVERSPAEIEADAEVDELEEENPDDDKTLETAPPKQIPAVEQIKEAAKPTVAEVPGKDKTVADPNTQSDKDQTGVTSPASETNPLNYQESYTNLMAPFTANGKTIELKTPEEARQLMQMGANYTRKMQAIAPHRKILTMLENNNLLNEANLSYLIEVSKKNPEAIKKLVKESGINPLDIDTEAESTYKPVDHSVSDVEVNFRAALEDVGSMPEGQALLQEVDATWDTESKQVLYKNPELLSVFREQKTNGVFEKISKEIEHRKILGNIPAQMPFIQAYKTVGDDLASKNAFKATTNTSVQGNTEVTAVPVAVRKVATKPPVANSKQASAASTTRTTPRKAEAFVNPLAMSDDDFLKMDKRY